MKRLFLTLACMVLLQAQASILPDLRILNHLAIGAEIGTPGWSVDLAVPVTPFVDVQAGFTMLPKFSLNPTLKMSTTSYAGGLELPMNAVDTKAYPTMKELKVMVNVMPVPFLTSFHITGGIYYGSGDVLEISNQEPLTDVVAANQAIDAYNTLNPEARQEHIGLKLGHYRLEPDQQGNIKAQARVRKVKPYVGIGFGRAVPKKRIGVKVDLGCIIWGEPTVYANGIEATTTDIGDLSGGITKTISKLPVYPVLNIRVCGRIF